MRRLRIIVFFSAFGSFSAIGTWYIPYTHDSYASDSQYLHCGGGVQSAVTHSGVTINLHVISLQWKPPDNYHGMVTITATVVRDYRTYWNGLESTPVHVVSQEDEDEDTEDDSDDNMYIDSDTLFGDVIGERNGQQSKVNLKFDLPIKVTPPSRYGDNKTSIEINKKVKSDVNSPPTDSEPSASLDQSVSYSHYLPYNIGDNRPSNILQQTKLSLAEQTENFRSTNADTDYKAATEATETSDKVWDGKTIDLNTSIFVTTLAVRKSRVKLEDPYRRLEAQYGSWKKSGAGTAQWDLKDFLSILVFLELFMKIM